MKALQKVWELLKVFLKWVFKFRHFYLISVAKWGHIKIYWSQKGRWELGVSVDINGTTLVSVNLIVLHIEIDRCDYTENVDYPQIVEKWALFRCVRVYTDPEWVKDVEDSYELERRELSSRNLYKDPE